MNIDQVKAGWNKSIRMYEKAEQLAFENPDKFEEYSYLVKELCIRRRYLKDKYLTLTGINISDDIYYNGF